MQSSNDEVQKSELKKGINVLKEKVATMKQVFTFLWEYQGILYPVNGNVY